MKRKIVELFNKSGVYFNKNGYKIFVTLRGQMIWGSVLLAPIGAIGLWLFLVLTSAILG